MDVNTHTLPNGDKVITDTALAGSHFLPLQSGGYGLSTARQGYYVGLDKDVNGVYSIPNGQLHYVPTPTPLPQVTVPSLGGGMPALLPGPSTPSMTPDPLLMGALKQGQDAINLANTPVDPTKFIAPGAVALLTKGVNDQLNTNRANAQSDFNARGMTGSSTEVGTLTRDLPAAANQALAEGTVKLLQAAYPLAMADKQGIIDATFKTASLTTQIRGLIGDEKFKQLSLDQQREIANQDVQLKLKLADVEMKFQASMKQAEFAFQRAENDKDRAVAQQQFEYLKQQRQKAQESAFITSLTSLAGIGIGLAMAPATGGASMMMTSAAVGGMAGQAAGQGISGLFLAP